MIPVVFGFVLCLNSISCQIRKLETFAVGGEHSNITEFFYSACIKARFCETDTAWICGSSILNERIILTAAHCVYGCNRGATIIAQFGNADRYQANSEFIKKYIIHKGYTETSTHSDIALAKVENPLKLNINVGRVAIYPMQYTPYGEMGKVAGWGFVDEIQEITSSQLNHISQKILKRKSCEKLIGEKLHVGVICGGGNKTTSYVSVGDSGSPLVVRGYIQAGIVSYKEPSISRSIAMYTDVGFYFVWIHAHAMQLYCS